MPSTTKAEPKQTPTPKSELLLDVASEAKILRTDGGNPAVIIPNHPTQKGPVPLLDSYDFVCWLTWRCYKKHGFLPSAALINTVLRALAGQALFDPDTAVIETSQPLPHAAHIVSIQPNMHVRPVAQPASAQQPTSQPRASGAVAGC